MAKSKKGKPEKIEIAYGDVRKFCLEQEQEIFDGMLDGVIEGKGNPLIQDGEFMIVMAIQSLIETATHILSMEWHIANSGPKSKAKHTERWKTELDEHRLTFSSNIRRLKEALADSFAAQWDAGVYEHNVCARANLDNSGGKTHCHVIPRFHDDGTHDPVGDKDGPYGLAGKD